MKRFLLTFFLILGSLNAAFGQEGSIDLILLLDTSSSMSAAYREVNGYMTGSFLRDFLRPGDTFHLIPFAGSPRLDVSRRVEGRGDLETVIGRMLLQYPLEPWSDIAAALSYAENYAAALPARPKKIVLLSDGDVSPQPGVSSRALDEAGLQSLINSAQERLRGRGISLDYVKVSPGSANPLAVLPASGRPPMPVRSEPLSADSPSEPGPALAGPPPSRPLPEASGGPAPGAVQDPPGSQGRTGGPYSGVPGTNVPGLNNEGPAGGTGGPSGMSDPSAEGSGMEDWEAPPVFSEDGGFPAAGDPAFGETGSGSVVPPAVFQPPIPPPARYNQDGLSLPIIIGLAILGLAALGLIIFLVTRRLQGTPNRAMAQAAAASRPESAEESGPPTDHSAALANYAASQQRQRTGPYSHRYTPQNIEPYEGPLLLNLFVEDQNTFIGKRNIHAVKSGYTFTVGGGKSDFLIFLVPIPPHIGDIRCEGNRCTFIPRKPQYFPDIGSQQVPDCIGKTIRIISDKKYELHFRFERYEDPLKALNRLLHSVQVPG
jgi:hypothetical protein